MGKNYSATVAISSVTYITAAKWNMVMSGIDCSAVNTALVGTTAPAASAAPCTITNFTGANNGLTTTSWFQPKELSTKVYTPLPRFSAKESATWTGMVAADGKKSASGCATKALTGAPALVAGAAVAFGAAALAF